MPKEQMYTVTDLINVYISSQRPDHIDFVNYYKRLVLALQEAFGVTITNNEGVGSGKRAIYMLFHSTIQSFITIKTPGSGFSDASLILKQLEASPIDKEVQQIMNSIDVLTEENIKSHRKLIDVLFSYLYNPTVATVTSQDLYNLGFDDSTEPNPNDYEY